MEAEQRGEGGMALRGGDGWGGGGGEGRSGAIGEKKISKGRCGG